ncbi:hypothetical protein [Stenotrophomonas sp.]|uniref:hypothetical protein n=1 Tax=Stenotrophomonas sp. TaxID=69392 RepID=UPI0028AA3CC0|nr:hypothetical protein [Stenotrophomonas sp.]
MSNMTLEGAMNISTNNTTKARPAKRMRLRAGVLSIALLLGTQNAYAGMPVIDITSIIGDIRSWISDTTTYAKEAVRWNQIKQQIDEVRAIFDAFNYLIGLPDGAPLKKVPDKYLVEETCGKKALGFDLKTVFTLTGISAGDIASQQAQICVNIRMMQNKKYNDSIDFLEKTVKEAQEQMYKNFMSRIGSNKTGAVQAADSDTLRLGNELTMMAQQWGTRMQAYDAYIAGQEQNQNVLARAALKGNPKNKLLGDLVQTVALKGALSVD